MTEAARIRSPSARRMAEYRKRMRAKGLKPVTIWVQDKNDPAYLERCRLAVAAINADVKGEAEIMEWLDQVRDWPND